jgi:hypothetical protein
MKTFGLVIVLSVLSTPVSAQVKASHARRAAHRRRQTEPHRSRTTAADGRADLSGLWQRVSPKYRRNIAADLKPEEIKSSARALVAERMEDLGKGHMAVQCLPWGPGYATSERLVKIVQTPGLILMLDEGLTYRQIFMDGRALEREPNPSWMGYSVGRWEGDTHWVGEGV